MQILLEAEEKKHHIIQRRINKQRSNERKRADLNQNKK